MTVIGQMIPMTLSNDEFFFFFEWMDKSRLTMAVRKMAVLTPRQRPKKPSDLRIVRRASNEFL